MMVSAYLPGYHNIWGGAEMETLRIWDMMKSAGEEASMFCMDVETDKKIPPDMFTTGTMKDSLISRFPVIYSQLYQFGILHDFISAGNFGKVLDRIKPHIVHFHNFLPLSMSLVNESAQRKIPSLLSVYDYKYICMKETLFKDGEGVQCEDYGRGNCVKCMGISFPLLRHPLMNRRKTLFRKTLDKIDRIVCLSQNSKEIMMKAGYPEEKIAVIRASVDLSDIKTDNSPIEKGLILFVGWVQPRKGIHIVTKAFEIVAGEIPEAKLVIFGDGEQAYREMIEKELEKAGIAQKVDFRGKRPHEEVKDYMKRANVIVIAEQWQNMSPITMVEAMAGGKAVVAGKIGGIPEFIKDGKTGFLVEYNNPDAYSEKIISLIKNPELAETLGKEASQSVKTFFDREQIREEYIKLYHSTGATCSRDPN